MRSNAVGTIVGVAALVVCLCVSAASARDIFVVPASQASAARVAVGTAEAPFPSVGAALRSGRVSGGDRIVLREGHHGVIRLRNKRFNPPVRIVAEQVGQAHVDKIAIRSSAGLHFHGLSVWPRRPGTKSWNLIVTQADSPNIHFDRMDIRGLPRAPEQYLRWSKKEWRALEANGARLNGPRNRISNSTITGVIFGITTTGEGTEVIGNHIIGFGGDAMRGLGDNSVFVGNRAENCVKINENHDDGFQSWATKPDGQGRKVVRGLRVERNIILEWIGPPQHPLRCRLQGIGLFDGLYRDFVIRNNLIAISAYHGISLYAGDDSEIVNNTVVHISGGPADHPWIMLRDNRNGWKSGETLVRNNVAMSFKGIERPGRENVAARIPVNLFRDPGRLNFSPKSDSPLIDRGLHEAAPPVDLTGRRRQGTPDMGAIEAR